MIMPARRGWLRAVIALCGALVVVGSSGCGDSAGGSKTAPDGGKVSFADAGLRPPSGECKPACSSGQSCAKGACYLDTCRVAACRAGEVCQLDACVALACVGVTCSEGSICVKGVCAAKNCAGGEVCGARRYCDQGVCRDVLCGGVTCGAQQLCVAGACRETSCGGVACAQGQVCANGRCSETACVGASCASGRRCQAGECVACAARESICFDGLDEDCDGKTDCQDTDCGNQLCDDADLCTTGDRCGSDGQCQGPQAVPGCTPSTCIGGTKQPCAMAGVGTGLRTCSNNAWGACVVNACTNGATNPPGCNNVVCVPNAERACTTAGVGTGKQTCAKNAWGSCVVDTCTNGSTNPPACNNLVCTAGSIRACTSSKGTAMQTCTNNAWGPCVVTTCTNGFQAPDCVCSVAITQGPGVAGFPDGPNYRASWASHGGAGACSWTLDGVVQGPWDCSGTLEGAWLSAGRHPVGLVVGSGADGGGSCRTEAIVISTTTCRVVVEPEAGGTFKATWASNGSSCTWALDDGPSRGSVDCNGVAPGIALPAGAHTIKLKVGNGYGGIGHDYTCASNSFTVP